MRYALLRAAGFSVHPVANPATVKVRQNSPLRLGPQWADAFLIVIELRSSSPAGRVDANPLGRAASRTGLRYRSTVAALIAMSSSNTSPP